MPYATIADLVDRFEQDELVQLSNPNDPTATVINELKVQPALDDAAAVIDAKIGKRYTLPLTNVPRLLRNLCCDLARAYLYEDRITDRVKERETAALKLLDEIRDGKASLGLDEIGNATESTADVPAVTGSSRNFSNDLLSDYRGA